MFWKTRDKSDIKYRFGKNLVFKPHGPLAHTLIHSNFIKHVHESTPIILSDCQRQDVSCFDSILSQSCMMLTFS